MDESVDESVDESRDESGDDEQLPPRAGYALDVMLDLLRTFQDALTALELHTKQSRVAGPHARKFGRGLLEYLAASPTAAELDRRMAEGGSYFAAVYMVRGAGWLFRRLFARTRLVRVAETPDVVGPAN